VLRFATVGACARVFHSAKTLHLGHHFKNQYEKGKHMSNSKTLLRAWAASIDDLDGQITVMNDDKKAIYASAKETLAPAEFKAWKDAVKLRQKRRTNRQEMDDHDGLVADMLFVLETTGLTEGANSDTRAHPQAHEQSHEGFNPETGELTTEANTDAA
jgi:uncharacterized protein (UPF0335 family)